MGNSVPIPTLPVDVITILLKFPSAVAGFPLLVWNDNPADQLLPEIPSLFALMEAVAFPESFLFLNSNIPKAPTAFQ